MPDEPLLDRLVRSLRGEAPAPTEPPAEEPGRLSQPPEDDDRAAEADALDETVAILSEQILADHLHDRRHRHLPLDLDLGGLDRDRAALFVHAMIAAARADGSLDGIERNRIEGTLRFLDAADDELAFLDEAIAAPLPLFDILDKAGEEGAATLVYAASLMAVDRRKPVNRQYLRYVAARLGLTPGLVERLERRYRSAA